MDSSGQYSDGTTLDNLYPLLSIVMPGVEESPLIKTIPCRFLIFIVALFSFFISIHPVSLFILRFS